MSESAPTPSEAQAALADANSQAARVRRSDHHLGWIALGIALVYLAVGALISTLPDPRRAGPVVGPAILAVMVVGLVGLVIVVLRMRAYSRTGILLYFGGVIVFNLWNGIIVGTSIITRWWALGQPSYHFGLSAAVGSIPLLVAAWLILRR
jgi:asparagine N-glycosylation enzyme membrane subunit Stt3